MGREVRSGRDRMGPGGRYGRTEGAVRTLTVSGLTPSALDRPVIRSFGAPIRWAGFRSAERRGRRLCPLPSHRTTNRNRRPRARVGSSGAAAALRWFRVGSTAALRTPYGGSMPVRGRLGPSLVGFRWRSIAGSTGAPRRDMSGRRLSLSWHLTSGAARPLRRRRRTRCRRRSGAARQGPNYQRTCAGTRQRPFRRASRADVVSGTPDCPYASRRPPPPAVVRTRWPPCLSTS